MKSLKESLFDKDLVERDLPKIGDEYKIKSIDTIWSDYYGFYNGPDEDKVLIEKMFKPKIKSIKPVDYKDIKFVSNDSRPDIFEPFLRILTVVCDLPILPGVEDLSWYDLYDDIINKDFPQYVNKSNMNIALYKPVYDQHGLYFEIVKGFGAKNKWIKLRAHFIEK